MYEGSHKKERDRDKELGTVVNEISSHRYPSDEIIQSHQDQKLLPCAGTNVRCGKAKVPELVDPCIAV